MAVNTRVFKVDAGATVFTHDDLQFVVPSVRASSDLNTLLDFAGPAEHVHANFSPGSRFCVIEAKDEERRVDNVETVGIVRTFFSLKYISKTRPDFAIFRAQHTKGTLCCFLNWDFGGIIDDDFQVDGNILLSHDKI